MLTLTDDKDWDEELVGTASKGYKALKSTLIDGGLVQYYRGNTFVYLTSMNKWGVLISAEAQRQICDITGSESATVNYLGASLPFIGFLEKHAKRASAIPPSLCIGTRRLAIYKEDDKITLEECSRIATVDEQFDARVQELCVMPCAFNSYPTSWSFDETELLFRFVRVLFIDEIEFKTALWIIGMIATDPSSTSKFLLLYGEGGTGKSTFISVIEDVFSGCCGTIHSSVLTTKNYNVATETARIIASNRVVTAGDLNLENLQMNLHTVKEITGHDTISIPPIKIRTRCSLVAASNDLPHPMIQKTWSTSAISRRVVVLPMVVKTSMIPDVQTKQRPDSIFSLTSLLMLGVNTYLDNMYSMPISIRSLLLGLIGSGYNEIEEKIEYDKYASIQEILDANTSIEIYFGLELHTLGELASLVSPDMVGQFIGINELYYIKNIKLKGELVRDD